MSQSERAKGKHPALVYSLLLIATLAALFWKCSLPGFIHFNNDNPLGAIKPAADNLGSSLTGRWSDLNSVGVPNTLILPNVTAGVLAVFGAVGFAKFAAPIALLVLGLCAWLFFRQLGLSTLACVLGGLAAALNLGFLSTACWGVVGQPVAFGTSYLALAAVVSPVPRGRWALLALAGIAMGLTILEALDIGALFSLVVAAFIVYHEVVAERGSPSRGRREAAGGSEPVEAPGNNGRAAAGTAALRLGLGVVKVAIVAVVAGCVSFGLIKEMVRTQITSIAGMQDSTESKAQRWDWAVQWSTPKREVLSLAIPGLFGYRMDRDSPEDIVSAALGLFGYKNDAEGWNYWGAGGRGVEWDRYFAGDRKGPPPGTAIRWGGGGGYAGLLVVVLVVWAAAQAFRKKDSVFSIANRRLIWFWLAVMLVALLLGFGRYTPIYWYFYQLPLASIFRNPGKFGHIFTWSLVVVFAYGVHGLSKRYMETEPAGAGLEKGRRNAGPGLKQHLGGWWSRVRGFDRKWTWGCLGTIALAVLGWLVYDASRGKLEEYLQTVQFDARMAKAIAGFSIAHVGWFVLRLILVVALLTLALSGWFSGRRARLGGLLLGMFLVVDLAVIDRHWIIFWDADQKYATNPVIEQLRQRPYEHRVALLPQWIPSMFGAPPQIAAQENLFDQLYRIEWAQHHFQYFSVQSLDVVQMPRVPADLEAFEDHVRFEKVARTRGVRESLFLVPRLWQLTNTRYLLGAADLLQPLNQVFDPGLNRFRILTRFHLALKPGLPQFSGRLEELTAVPATNQPSTLLEFGSDGRLSLVSGVPTNGPYAIIEFAAALPRAKLYSSWEVSTNDTAVLEKLANPAFDPEKSVLISSPPAGFPLTPAPSPGERENPVTFTSYSPKHIVLQAKAAAPSVLLLNDKFDVNWKVAVDGSPAALLRCNYLMRGVQVPAGDHRIEFEFDPPHGGLYLNLAALAAGFALLGYVVVVGRRGQD